MKKIIELYKKYKEVINYLIFGGLSNIYSVNSLYLKKVKNKSCKMDNKYPGNFYFFVDIQIKRRYNILKKLI